MGENSLGKFPITYGSASVTVFPRFHSNGKENRSLNSPVLSLLETASLGC